MKVEKGARIVPDQRSLLISALQDDSPRSTLRALYAQSGDICWERALGHPVSHLALVHAGVVLFAASEDHCLSAFRISDGAPLWETALPENDRSMESLSGACPIATNGEVVAVYDAGQISICRCRDGSLLWTLDPTLFRGSITLAGVGVSSVYLNERRPVGTPRTSRPVSDRTLEERKAPRRTTYVTYATSADDGVILWKTPSYVLDWSEARDPGLTEVDGVTYRCGNRLQALDSATGALLWSQPKSGYTLYDGVPAVDDAIIFATSRESLRACHSSSGGLIWRDIAPGKDTDYGHFQNASQFAHLLLMDGSLYVSCAWRGDDPSRSGFQILALDKGSGAARRIWPEDPVTLDPHGAWSFQGAHGMLFVPSFGQIHVVRATDGTQVWQTQGGPFLAVHTNTPDTVG
jgi:outer membrane protein assembly factor BamB